MNRKKQILLVFSLVLVLLPFQNCGKLPGTCSNTEGGSACTSGTSTNSSASTSKKPPSSTTTVTVGAGGSGSSSGGGGFSSSPPPSGSGAGGGISPPPVSTPGSGGSLKITRNPESRSVTELSDFQFQVEVTGGQAPFTFQWHRNGKALDLKFTNYAFFSDVADSFAKEGKYFVLITDAQGTKVQSGEATLSINEVHGSCPSGSYFMATNSTEANQTVRDLFSNSRGQFYVHGSYKPLSFFNLSGKDAKILEIMGFARSDLFPSGEYGSLISLPCRSTLPMIHTPTRNPASTAAVGYGMAAYNDGNGYAYQGGIQFECRNAKWFYKTKTCAWVGKPTNNNNSSTR